MANVCFIEPFRLCVLSFILFYVYGIKRIEDDFLFQTGRNVIKFLKVIWPLYPLFYAVSYLYINNFKIFICPRNSCFLLLLFYNTLFLRD